MKKLYSFSLALIMLAAIAGIASCSKEPTVIPFNVGDLTITIPSTSFTGQVTEASTTVNQSDIKAAYAAAGQTFNVSKISTTKLKKIKIKASTTGINLSSIEGISVFAKDFGALGDGEQVAYVTLTSNDKTGSEVSLTVSGFELKDWLQKDKFVLMARVWYGNSAATHQITLTEGVIEIEAKK